MELGRDATYPVRGEHGETAVVAGLTLSYLLAGLLRVGGAGVLVAAVVGVALAGYVVRVLAASAAGDPHPPGFGGPASLLVGGVRGLVLLVGYGVVPVAALAAGEAAIVSLVGGGAGGVAPYVALVVSMGTLVVVLPFAYLLPAALTRAGHAASLRAGLPSRSLVASVRSVDYFVGWAAAATLLALAVGVAGTLFASPSPVANALAVALAFYAAVVGAHVAGRGYDGLDAGGSAG